LSVRHHGFSHSSLYKVTSEQAPRNLLIEALQMVNQAVTSQAGFANGKIYADMSGPFDTVVWQFEAESLDKFYQVERGVFVNPDAATQRLLDTLNGSTVEGQRQIYEIIL
jgi:hypothetical protein